MNREGLIKLRDTVLKLGEDYPDARYQRVDKFDRAACNYTLGEVKNGPVGEVGCIVGQAAYLLGDTELIAECEAADADGGLGIEDIIEQLCIDWVYGGDGLDVDEFGEYERLRNFISGVQQRQDEGETWGAATGVTG